MRLLLSLTFAVCFFGVTWPGYAIEPPGRAAQVSTSLADHIRAGDRARLAGRWAEAAVAYQAALQAAKAEGLPEEKRAPILGELGVCEEALGKHRDAAEHLDLALEQRNTLSPEQRRRFEAAQSKAENQVSWLVISVDPPDAEVLVDGKSIGASKPSHIVFVEPGRHTVRARLTGHAEAVNAVDAPKARWSGVWLRLSRAPRTLSQAAPKAGPRALTSSRAGAPAPVTSAGRTAKTWRTVGIVTTASLAVLGTSFLIGDTVLDDQVEERASKIRERGGPWACRGEVFREDCEDLHTIASARDVLNPLAVWSLIGAGVVGGATLSSFWWAPAEPPRARAQIRVVPTASARQAGAMITATW